LFLALSFAWDTSESKTGLMKLPPRKPVTDESRARLKKIEQQGKPGKIQEFIENWKNPIEQETLVDGEVLLWAYIEAGTIETLGCLVAYFFSMWYSYGVTPADAVKYGAIWGLPASENPPEVILSNLQKLSIEQQLACLANGQSAYYLALMIQQCFNLFCCKARLRLPFGKFMFSNPKNFFGILAGAAFTMAIVYIPYINVAFGTNSTTTPITWLVAFGFGIVLFIYSTIRFLIRRYANPIKYSKDIQGLDLHPTKFSTGR
jgi:sodium/potassium-transporting ATPase subunit alpha